MNLKHFLFGRPSRASDIEKEYSVRLKGIRDSLAQSLAPVERELEAVAIPSRGDSKLAKMDFASRVKRLDELEAKISSMQDDADEQENKIWFAMMNELKEDGMASSNLFKRMYLWLYWHA